MLLCPRIWHREVELDLGQGHRAVSQLVAASRRTSLWPESLRTTTFQEHWAHRSVVLHGLLAGRRGSLPAQPRQGSRRSCSAERNATRPRRWRQKNASGDVATEFIDSNKRESRSWANSYLPKYSSVVASRALGCQRAAGLTSFRRAAALPSANWYVGQRIRASRVLERVISTFVRDTSLAVTDGLNLPRARRLVGSAFPRNWQDTATTSG